MSAHPFLGDVLIPTGFGPQTISRMVQHYCHMARYERFPAKRSVFRARLRDAIRSARYEASLPAWERYGAYQPEVLAA